MPDINLGIGGTTVNKGYKHHNSLRGREETDNEKKA